MFETFQKYFLPQLSEAATEGVLYKKGAPRNFAKFTGKHLCQSLFLIELQTGLQHFKKETLAQAVSCEYCEISKNTFFTEHLWATASGLQKFAVGKKKTAANKVKKPADVP